MLSTWKSDLSLAADMGEYITLSHLDKSKFRVVAVSRIIW
jgi:hypothetical protein